MNAGAYGSDWSAIVVRALVATADGTGWLTPQELGLSYRHSNLAARPGRGGRRVPAHAARRRTRSARSLRDLVERRKATQPTTKRTFGSVFKNPPGELGAGAMLELCGLKGYRIGGAVISPKHANFIENAGDATTADCLALMAEARRRAREAVRRRARARGRAARRSRDRRLQPVSQGFAPSAANTTAWPPGDESNVDRVPVRARRVSSSRFRDGPPASASIWPGSFPPAARSASRS